MEVARPLTTSTSFITGAGLKKCSPATRSGFLTPAAIAVIEIDEVLLVNSVDGAQIAASCVNSAVLTSNRSEAASITKSASASAAKSWAGCRRASSASACSDASLPRATRDARRPAIPSIARSTALGLISKIRTGCPAAAATSAMPAPMVPLPITATVAKDVVIIYFPLNCGGRLARNALTPSR